MTWTSLNVHIFRNYQIELDLIDQSRSQVQKSEVCVLCGESYSDQSQGRGVLVQVQLFILSHQENQKKNSRGFDLCETWFTFSDYVSQEWVIFNF